MLRHDNGVGDGWWADCGRRGWTNVVVGRRESCGKKRRIYNDDLARAIASALDVPHRNPYAKEGRRRQPTQQPAPSTYHPSFHIYQPFPSMPLKLTASPHPQIHHPQELPRSHPQPSRQVRCPRRRFRRCSRLLRPLLLRRGTQGTRRHHEEDSRSRQVLHQRDTARGQPFLSFLLSYLLDITTGQREYEERGNV